MTAAFLWGALAGSALLVGYFISLRGMPNRVVGLIMGFGSGALVSAVAYELVPETVLGGWEVPAALLVGALTFFLGDLLVSHRGGSDRKALAAKTEGSGAAIFVGTLLDGIPEAVVLGMGLAHGGAVSMAFLAAVFISNLPEGVAGTLNLTAAAYSRKHILLMWVALVALTAVGAALGYLLVEHIPAADSRVVQAFAAGALLTMLADSMMPEAFEHGGPATGLSTALGFVAAAGLSVLG